MVIVNLQQTTARTRELFFNAQLMRFKGPLHRTEGSVIRNGI